jgi:hypothetical protein
MFNSWTDGSPLGGKSQVLAEADAAADQGI